MSTSQSYDPRKLERWSVSYRQRIPQVPDQEFRAFLDLSSVQEIETFLEAQQVEAAFEEAIGMLRNIKMRALRQQHFDITDPTPTLVLRMPLLWHTTKLESSLRGNERVGLGFWFLSYWVGFPKREEVSDQKKWKLPDPIWGLQMEEACQALPGCITLEEAYEAGILEWRTLQKMSLPLNESLPDLVWRTSLRWPELESA